MLLSEIVGPAHKVTLIFISNQICALLFAYYSVESYARLVDDMEEGISKRCAFLSQKLVELR